MSFELCPARARRLERETDWLIEAHWQIGNYAVAAEAMGIPRRTAYERLRKAGVRMSRSGGKIRNTKVCPQCGLIKRLWTDFGKGSNRPDGRRAWCKDCEKRKAQELKWADPKAYQRRLARWRETVGTPEQQKQRYLTYLRGRRLKAQYGITDADYEQMFKAQNGKCAICETDKPGSHYKHFAVDHNHKTGAVRGLLCNRCNRLIGLADEEERIFTNAISYLR